MRPAIPTFAALVALGSVAVAEPLPVAKIGSCPSGWMQSGGYCAPMSARSPAAVPKASAQCPAGWMQSGAYCVRVAGR
jgi:hypothetical protein